MELSRMLLSLAYRSLKNRKLTSILTLLSLALSVSLWVGIEHIRLGARESFSNTISQTDLIVGCSCFSTRSFIWARRRPT
jgi:putative ABC transport system permease protein